MTDAALNEFIARAIEPKPDYRPTITGSISGVQIFTDRASVTVAWMYQFRIECGPADMSNEALESGAIEEERGSWQPRDFVNDPACTVELMERLLTQPNRYATVWWAKEGFSVQFRPDGKLDSYVDYATADKLGRAVAEAFCRANGMEVQ